MGVLRMRDHYTGKSKDILRIGSDTRDWKAMSGTQLDSALAIELQREPLLVYIAATHAGLINGNSRFYRPDRMMDSVKTWVPKNGFAKPVLVGHDDEATPLGRVQTAKYVDESHKYSVDFPIIRDSLFYRSAADKRMGLYESIDWIVDNLQEQEDYQGLGYIELGLKVTNPDAIEKVLRDEYLTVSVGFKTDSAICSICHSDWAQDDRCEHKMGNDYDGKKMFIISGNFDYEEVSFVNFPADPFAGIISKKQLTDRLEKVFFLGLSTKQQQASGLNCTDSLLSADIEFEDNMTQTVVEVNNIDPVTFEAEIKGATLTKEKALELKKSLKEWTPETDELQTKKRSLVSSLNAKIKKNGWDKETKEVKNTENKVDKTELEAALENCTSCTNEDEENWSEHTLTEEDKAFFDDTDGIYAEMEVEIDAAVAAGELEADAVKDAKLSTGARKKLSGSTFCGPGRSFPVPDCAHVVAARRLIGRASVSSETKSKILACVSRKPSSLSCGGKKDSEVKLELLTDLVKSAGIDAKSEKGWYPGEVIMHYEKLHGHYDKAESEIRQKMRLLHHAVGEHWGAKDAEAYYKAHLEKNDYAVLTKAELADKEKALNDLAEEIEVAKKSIEDNKKSSDEVQIRLLETYKKGLATQIVMYKTLTGAEGFKDLTAEQRTVKVDELSKRHVTSLKDNVADIMSELKWIDATSTTRKEEDSDPGHAVNDNAQVTEAVVNTDTTVDEARKAREFYESLQFMTQKERTQYLLSLDYEAVKKSN